jgi:hypothetical protein
MLVTCLIYMLSVSVHYEACVDSGLPEVFEDRP